MSSSKMLLWLILLNTVEVKKKRGVRALDRFTKKLMVPDYEIPEYPEFEAKSKLGGLFMN